MLAYSLLVLSVLVGHSYSYEYEHPKHPDHHYVSRPCETSDLDCIRRFFAQNSACSPVYKPAPDCLVFPCLRLPVPHANLTFFGIDYVLEGVKNYVIKEFYVNKATGNLVFEIEFKELKWNTPTAIIRYYMKGKEPVDLKDFFTLQHKSISFTLVVSTSHRNDIGSGSVYTYIGDSNISFKAGPGFVDSDPIIQAAYKAFGEKYITTFEEGYLNAGTAVMWSFIQHTICDFHKDASNNC